MGNGPSGVSGAGASAVDGSHGVPLPAVSRGTDRLHTALDTMWDLPKLTGALSAGGASAAAFRPVDASEQFVIFCPPSERTSGAAFALTALGRFASNLISHIVARETGGAESKLDRDTPPRVLAVLLSAGADAGMPLHASVSSKNAHNGLWAPANATLFDALRLTINAVKKSDQRARSRAAFLEPVLAIALASPAVTHLTALDLFFWAQHTDIINILVKRGIPVLTPHGDFVPPLIAAVDAGSAPALKALIEAGADPNADASRTRGGATPLMRAAGAGAFPPPPAAGSYGAHRGVISGTTDAADAAEEAEEAAADRPTRALVEALLHAGADVHAVDHDGATALHAFVGSEALKSDPGLRLAICLRLLDAGARMDVKDAAGRTPGAIAEAAFPKDAARFIKGMAERVAAKPI